MGVVPSADAQYRMVGELRPGDRLRATSSPDEAAEAQPAETTVLRVDRKAVNTGLWAPMTAAGTVVVDGVVASVYASPCQRLQLPHAAAHAMLFLPRLFSPLLVAASSSFSSSSYDGGLRQDSAMLNEEMHPYLEVVHNWLQLHRFLQMSHAA